MLHDILGYYTLEVNLRSGLDVMPSMTWGGGHEAEGGGAEPISVNQRQRKLYWGGGASLA